MTITKLKNVLKKHGVGSNAELTSELIEMFELSESTLEERKSEFVDTLKPYLEEYGRELLNEFYFYWSATAVNGRKMKFEKERSWSLESRLRNWAKNSKKFSIVGMLNRK